VSTEMKKINGKVNAYNRVIPSQMLPMTTIN